jgi:hypothetical protein
MGEVGKKSGDGAQIFKKINNILFGMFTPL